MSTTGGFLGLKDATLGLDESAHHLQDDGGMNDLQSTEKSSTSTSSSYTSTSAATAATGASPPPRMSEEYPDVAEFDRASGFNSIPPGSEKVVIILTVSTELPPGYHTGYLHISTNFEKIIMPVELQTLSTLVYPEKEEINFGTLSAPTEAKTHGLWVKNLGSSVVQVTEIIPVEPDSNLRVELVKNPIIHPGSQTKNLVANLVYFGERPGFVKNRLLVITNDTNAASAVFEVAYSAHVMHGGVMLELEQLSNYNGELHTSCDFVPSPKLDS